MKRNTFVGFVALVAILGGLISSSWGQDSLIVVPKGSYCSNTTVHLPVYARTNSQGGRHLQEIYLMFYNDHPGLHITSIEWDGPSIGESNTAINDYIGTPMHWTMDNECADSTCRGGSSLLTIVFGIPTGYHLLCWLVVETGAEGEYLIEPRDGIGSPPWYNQFWYDGLPGYPTLVGDSLTVVDSCFVRGDAEADGDQDIYDGLRIIYWIGGDAPPPPCINSADADDDEDTDIYDGLRIIYWIGGDAPPPPPPCCPIPDSCGIDPTPGALSCDSYPPCGWNP